MSSQSTREPSNPYVPTKPNDCAAELVQIVVNFYREHRSGFNPTEATNVGTAVTNILNGTNKV